MYTIFANDLVSGGWTLPAIAMRYLLLYPQPLLQLGVFYHYPNLEAHLSSLAHSCGPQAEGTSKGTSIERSAHRTLARVAHCAGPDRHHSTEGRCQESCHGKSSPVIIEIANLLFGGMGGQAGTRQSFEHKSHGGKNGTKEDG